MLFSASLAVADIETKAPPQDVEAEKSVLGAMLIDKDTVVKVGSLLLPEDFFAPNHQEIYRVVMRLFEDGSAVDVVTVAAALKKKKALKDIGGRTYLAELAGILPTASNAEYYAKIVKEHGVRRRLINMGSELRALGTSDKDLEEVLDVAEKGIFSISMESLEQGFVHIQELLMEAYERAESVAQQKEKIRGLATGFTALDNILGGLQTSNLIVVAARPSVGKTAFVLDMARHIAVNLKRKVGFFSLEMAREDLVDRLIAMEARIDLWGLRMGRLKRPDWRKVSDAMGVLHDADVYVDDVPGQHILQLRTKARRIQIEHGLDVLFVDYLQLIHASNRESRVQEVTEISQTLKNISRELRVPVVAVSQLSRAVEQRTSKLPQLSDLRESGAIEQDADVVAFLHREEMYDQDTDRKGIADIIVAKHRNGPCGSIELAFIAKQARFGNLTKAKDEGEVDVEKLMEG